MAPPAAQGKGHGFGLRSTQCISSVAQDLLALHFASIVAQKAPADRIHSQPAMFNIRLRSSSTSVFHISYSSHPSTSFVFNMQSRFVLAVPSSPLAYPDFAFKINA